jgi:transcriptional regulator with XRE-family HTH domain
MRGWGQRDLASTAGINQSVLSRLERDLQDDVMLSVVAALAGAFEVSIDSLTARTNTPKGQVIPELNALMEILGTQPKEVQQQVAGVIRGYLSTMPDQTKMT